MLWSDRETPAHTDWVSIQNVQCIGKYFGSVECQAQKLAAVDDSEPDTSLNNLAEATVDQIEELDQDIDERDKCLNKLQVSAQWMTHFHGKFCSSH